MAFMTLDGSSQRSRRVRLSVAVSLGGGVECLAPMLGLDRVGGGEGGGNEGLRNDVG